MYDSAAIRNDQHIEKIIALVLNCLVLILEILSAYENFQTSVLLLPYGN